MKVLPLVYVCAASAHSLFVFILISYGFRVALLSVELQRGSSLPGTQMSTNIRSA